MVESTQMLLDRFKAKKAEKDSTSLQEARRMVNLYRSLPCFGNDFAAKYNEMLLGIKPGVRRLLGTFMGGKEVEDYLEFLEENAHMTISEKNEQESTGVVPQNKGYLPDPESDTGTALKNEDTVSVSASEWEKMKIEKEALEKQTQELLNLLQNVRGKSAINKGESGFGDAKNSSFDNYSEILEDGSGENR